MFYVTGVKMAARVKKRTDTATNRESDRIIIRLPSGMRDRLHRMSEEKGRSMTAEVVDALSHWIDASTQLPAQVDRIERLIFENNQLVAEQVRLLHEKAGLPLPKKSEAATERAFEEFQKQVLADARALQKRKKTGA